MNDVVKTEDKNNNNKKDEEENSDEYLDIGNLNINQEVDIKENPKKHIVNSKKLNLIKSNTFSADVIDYADNSPKKNKKPRRITYDDIYLGNDMLFSRPKSYPRDYDKNNKYILSFTRENSKKSASNRNLINLSSTKSDDKINKNMAEEEENDEEETFILRSNTFEYFCQKGESNHLKDFLTSLNNHRNHKYEDINKKFIDEEEKRNKNIFYIENETELNNLNYYNKKNKCNISYISLNLFIKKLCTENLKEKYPILYKSFLDQYQEFLPISSLIEKIICAFEYYNKEMNIEIPDLILLLNKIISNQFKKIKDNESLIEKLIEV